MPKMYKTSKGAQIDIDAFTSKHENVRAVGNMDVNARGDLLDSTDKKIQSKNQRVSAQYRKQIGTTVADEPIYSSQRAAKRAQSIASEYASSTEQPVTKTIDGLDTPLPVETKTVSPDVDPTVHNEPVTEEAKSTGGLASALAKAREAKQEPLKTPQQIEREKPGVSKI